MEVKWLNFFLRYSAFTFGLKQKMIEAGSWVHALPYATLLILSELGFAIVSVPLYLIVSPKRLQETGIIFPTKQRQKEHFHVYVVRRKISLVTVFGAAGIWSAKTIFVGAVSLFFLGSQALLAAMQNWDFNTPSDYSYTAGKIAVTGGVAQLVDQGGSGSCSGTPTACSTMASAPLCSAHVSCAWGGGATGATTNPDFTANSTGWTGADWLWAPTTETRVATNGNPTGYIQISAPKAKSIVGGGYWYQAFTTTSTNPTATLRFDWSVTGYQAGATVTAYAFVDTGSGVPTIGNQVWSQAITGTSGWVSVTGLDVSSKITSPGTYYLKVAYYVNNGTGNTGPYTIGFDNVQLSWSKASVCSGTPTSCSALSSSSSCSAQTGCSWTVIPTYPTDKPAIYPNVSLAPSGVTGWNSFTETATKGTGEIYYQLSDDDGANWKYWAGSAWATSTLETDYNPASVVNTNIGTFSSASGQIKWKAFLSSDGVQQVSLDTVAVGYTQNNPPVISGLSASQNSTSGYVRINYTLSDAQSDPSSLIAYEYSTDNSNWSTMTAVPSDPAHSGVSGLSTSPSGATHAFIWDAQADLGAVYSTTVYVRLRANDGIASGLLVTSPAFTVDYVLPVVSSVTASQAPSSSDIEIAYHLADDTASNLVVEFQVSSDGGATWTVPSDSFGGDAGTGVTTGNNKSIVWHAGTDFANQEQDDMMVEVRAKDAYQNQGVYVSSGVFSLDNKAPVVATPANLLAQPLAGADTVLVGGGFTEGHPQTNNFAVAINGGSYAASVAGDADTATPSDKQVSVGSALTGADYISSVKIVHTDTFGHETTNETTSPNATYKYVKPYTPPAPIIMNPAEDSVDVTIVKNSAEADGLEYVLFENTQSKYVQADGTFTSSPAWQAIGTLHVTGLSMPISQYRFQVKSRNVNDAAHAVTSESDWGSAASSDYQSPQVSIDSVAQSTDGTKYILIRYTGTDSRNTRNSLATYEYSANGTDWQSMTEKTGVGSDGISDLAFTASGASLKFAWDVGADLANTEDSSVYIRLKSNDGVSDSNLAVSGAFVVDTAGPVVSGVSAVQSLSSDSLVIGYDLADEAGSNNTVELSISDDSGATYAVSAPSVTGDVGTGVTAGLGHSITWNAGTDFSDQEKNTMRAKIRAIDRYGNEGSFVESSDFSVDTKAPVIASVSATQASGSGLVTVNYTLSDLSTSTVAFSVSLDSGASWTVATTTFTGDMGDGQVPGVRTFSWNAGVDFPDQELSTMQVRVRATDVFGHQGAYEPSSDFSVNTRVLTISSITAVQTSGAKTVTIRYDLNKAATILLDISPDSGMTWTVATTTLTGHVGAGITAGTRKTITWNAGIDFDGQELSSMRIRLSGLDSFGVLSAYYESADFSVDTAGPIGLSALSKFASTSNSVTMNWSSGILDPHFNHYELWHGTNRADVLNRNASAAKWSVTQDADLATIGTISTVITGLTLTSDYYVKIWAVDDYGNETTVDDVNAYAPPTQGTLKVTKVLVNDDDGTSAVSDFVLRVGSTEVTSGETNSFLAGDYTISETSLSNYSATFSGDCDSAGLVTIEAGRSYTCTITNNDIAGAPAPVTPEEPAPASGGGGGSLPADTIAPAKPVLTELLTPTQETKILISGLAEPRARVDLYDNGTLVGRLESVADTNGQFSQSFDFGLGDHIFTMRAVDFADNVSELSDPVYLTITPVLISAPIVLTPQNDARITAATPSIVGVASPLATVELVLDAGNTFTVTADTNGGWQFQVPSSFALSNGSHTFVIRSIDATGKNSDPVRLVLNKVAPAPAPVARTTPAPAIPTPPSSLIGASAGAIELPGVPVPRVTLVNAATTNDTFDFTGTALPNQDVVVYVHSDQALIYRTKTNDQGAWTVNHSQEVVELSPGEHTVYAVAVDPAAKVKSRPSPVAVFTVEKSFWVTMFQYLNLRTTLITFGVLAIVIFWLYRLQKKESLKA